MEIAKVAKTRKVYYCEQCDYKCYRTNDYKKHLTTDKHNVSKDGNQMETVEIAKSQKEMKCECGKNYKNKSGLWKHQKKCKFIEENTKTTEENITIEINSINTAYTHTECVYIMMYWDYYKLISYYPHIITNILLLCVLCKHSFYLDLIIMKLLDSPIHL